MKELIFLAQYDFQAPNGALFIECRIILAANQEEAEEKGFTYSQIIKQRFKEDYLTDWNLHPAIS